MNATDIMVEIMLSPDYADKDKYLKDTKKKILLLRDLALHLNSTLSSEQMASPIESSVIKAFIDEWFIRDGYRGPQ